MGFIKTDTPSSAFKHAKAACADFPLSFPPVPGDRDPPRSVRDVGLQVPSLGCPRLGCGVCRAGGGADPPPPPAAGGDKAPGPPLSLCPPRSDDRRVHPGGGAPGGDPQPRQGAHGVQGGGSVQWPAAHGGEALQRVPGAAQTDQEDLQGPRLPPAPCPQLDAQGAGAAPAGPGALPAGCPVPQRGAAPGRAGFPEGSALPAGPQGQRPPRRPPALPAPCHRVLHRPLRAAPEPRAAPRHGAQRGAAGPVPAVGLRPMFGCPPSPLPTLSTRCWEHRAGGRIPAVKLGVGEANGHSCSPTPPQCLCWGAGALPSAHVLGLCSEPSERKQCWKTLLASGICVINHLDLMTKRWLICRSAKPTRGIAAATKGDALG